MDIKIVDGPSFIALEKNNLPFRFTISGPSLHSSFFVEKIKRRSRKGDSWEIEGTGKMDSFKKNSDFSAFYNSNTCSGTIKIRI